MNRIEIKIPKDISTYKESIALGLSMRQFICSALALAVSVGLFFLCKDKVGTEYASWICIAGAVPFAACGFFQYNNLTLEKFIIAYVRSEWIVPQTRYYASENFHYQLIFAPNPVQKKKAKKAKKMTKPKTIKE